MSFIEIEYKSLLNKDEFKRLSHQFRKIDTIEQTNHYFDTADRSIKGNRMSLRIRTFKDSAELTLKIPQTVGNEEINYPVTLQEAKKMIEGDPIPESIIKERLLEKNIKIEAIKCFGSLKTIRRETPIPIGLLAIDENHYSGKIDYEIELEVTDAERGKMDFNHFLKTNHVTFKYAKSKVARFAESIQTNDEKAKD